ncbi:hypothetical protein PILCRDRAFT_812217 [Piloderma croceum F 1598]|uniref:Uncharacterized protein n=1 Tax=Piloderma croceum (strain F 1598) TaxID=765440 RepID=A0A0C3BV86_PILCF|nr:hypothetical protein PILCRDRAFT_812217 [Piloderma croceum F 1598]
MIMVWCLHFPLLIVKHADNTEFEYSPEYYPKDRSRATPYIVFIFAWLGSSLGAKTLIPNIDFTNW